MIAANQSVRQPQLPISLSGFPDPIIQMIFQHIPQFIFWKDRRSVYLGCNDHFAQLVGFNSSQDVIGKTDHELGWLPDGDTAFTFQNGDQRTLQGHCVTNEEEWLSTRTGRRILTLINKVPIRDDDGKVIGVLGVATDITEKKAMTENLARTQYKLEGMTIVSASIAHELRTPLAALKIAAQSMEHLLPILMKGYQPFTTDEALPSEALQFLMKAAASLDKKVDEASQIINLLLTNVRECREGVFNNQRCSAKACIRQALDNYVFPVMAKPDIIWDENSMDFIFIGKEMLLVHVLFNLLKNAAYFIRKTGRGDIHIWLEQGERHNRIHFKDTAIGIPTEHLSHIFEPFFTAGVCQGTGVGLAFCAFTLQAFGGSLRCQSVYGEYAEFILEFPVCTV